VTAPVCGTDTLGTSTEMSYDSANYVCCGSPDKLIPKAIQCVVPGGDTITLNWGFDPVANSFYWLPVTTHTTATLGSCNIDTGEITTTQGEICIRIRFSCNADGSGVFAVVEYSYQAYVPFNGGAPQACQLFYCNDDCHFNGNVCGYGCPRCVVPPFCSSMVGASADAINGTPATPSYDPFDVTVPLTLVRRGLTTPGCTNAPIGPPFNSLTFTEL